MMETLLLYNPRVIHSEDMYNHCVDHLCLSIDLGVEGNRFGHLGVHHGPNDGLEDT
jgi:hypothetical protein